MPTSVQNDVVEVVRIHHQDVRPARLDSVDAMLQELGRRRLSGAGGARDRDEASSAGPLDKELVGQLDRGQISRHADSSVRRGGRSADLDCIPTAGET